MSFEIEVDIKEVKEALKKISKKVNSLKPAFNQIGYYLLEVVEDSFANEQSPDGKAWEKLSPSYLLQKSKKGYTKILQNKGTLAESIDFTATADHLTLGTNIVYAPIHQFGGKAGRNKKATIPARPFLPIDIDDNMPKDILEDIIEIIQEHIELK